MEFSLVGEVNKYLIERENKREKMFSASDMGTCKLKRYWQRQGKEKVYNERTLRVFAVGHVFHDWMQSITKDLGISVLSENRLTYKVDGKEMLIGHHDDLLAVGDGHVLYDYKTVHSGAFHYLKGEGNHHPHYRKQIITYSMMLKQMNPEYKDLTDLRLLYISKDDLCMKEVAVFSDTETEEAIHQEILELNDHWDRQVEPKAVPEGEWECKDCVYKKICTRGNSYEIAERQKAMKKAQKTVRL